MIDTAFNLYFLKRKIWLKCPHILKCNIKIALLITFTYYKILFCSTAHFKKVLSRLNKLKGIRLNQLFISNRTGLCYCIEVRLVGTNTFFVIIFTDHVPKNIRIFHQSKIISISFDEHFVKFFLYTYLLIKTKKMLNSKPFWDKLQTKLNFCINFCALCIFFYFAGCQDSLWQVERKNGSHCQTNGRG